MGEWLQWAAGEKDAANNVAAVGLIGVERRPQSIGTGPTKQIGAIGQTAVMTRRLPGRPQVGPGGKLGLILQHGPESKLGQLLNGRKLHLLGRRPMIFFKDMTAGVLKTTGGMVLLKLWTFRIGDHHHLSLKKMVPPGQQMSTDQQQNQRLHMRAPMRGVSQIKGW